MLSSSVCPIPAELQKIIDEGYIPTRGGKRKAKEEFEERIVTEVQEDNTLINEEEDIVATSEPTPTKNILKVSSPPTSSILEPKISVPLSSPIFSDLTPPTTSTISTPPKVLNVKSISEETKTSGIIGNTSDVGLNATIGVTSEHTLSSVPLVNDDNEILFEDDQEPNAYFVFHPSVYIFPVMMMKRL
ncbi:unnamed protein product [Lactuca saligna]|uniref:Uncharacterized protein n=1 Tax=Lactuca saligna TaxID=75948 RepID=A0AA35VPG8_LACSI|nr:unnamed protein product [Lactuca saligna]